MACQNANEEAANYFVSNVLQAADPQDVDLDSYTEYADSGEATYTVAGSDDGVGGVVSVERQFFRDIEDMGFDDDGEEEGEEEEELDGVPGGVQAPYPPPEDDDEDGDGDFEDEEELDDFGDDDQGDYDDEPVPSTKRKKM
jgi:hypothetical protein